MKILIALLAVCLGSAALWASLDHPLAAPDWAGKLGGISYSPSGLYHEAALTQHVPEAVIRGDLRQLAKVTPRIRTYTVDRGLDRVPYIAKEVGLKVTLGIWLSGDRALNEAELARGIDAIKDNPDTVDRVIVGNETLLRGELTAADVVAYMQRVRAAIADPAVEVGTAEVWNVWLKNPSLAKGSAFVGVHLLPYWEGIGADASMGYITDRFGKLTKAFPDKHIVIAEAGWPSEGRVKKASVPSPAMEALFIRKFVTLAAENGYDYYVIEAYDQPWKAEQEGAVGAFWGLYDADRAAKFSFSGELTSFAQWKAFALASGIATLMVGIVVLSLLPAVQVAGYLLLAGIVALVVAGVLFIVDAMSLRYIDWGTVGGAVLVLPAVLFTALVLVTETAEWALSLWRTRRKTIPTADFLDAPRVSIHVPTHREPPQMVIETLDALARLDYPNFEVIVLDNNTPDESDWRPVAAHCDALGSRFRFFHFNGMKGFKAGALNKALELTDPSATLIAVIDSDYQVAPQWLKTAVPAFAHAQVALVQAPQDYRDADESLLKKCCYEEYRSFFHVGMVERDEHNAIIQHGTMCVVRRSALEEVGGWAPWCITEDTELGLRLFAAGYTAHYISASLGQGLMPDTYAAYKTQRYRWVYGAMQILKRHASLLFTRSGKLTLAQRYHFVAGWLPWMADAFALIFSVLAVVWTALVVISPKHFDVPLTALSAVALALFVVKTVKTIVLHRAKVGAGIGGSITAALTGLSLAYIVGKGVLFGLFTSSNPFVRTPKCEDSAPISTALRISAAETGLLTATLAALAASVMVIGVDDPAERVWALALAVLSVPYAAALVVALASCVKPARRPVLAPEVSPAPTTYRPADLDLAA
jgi:exo-beta-1,3-glucanase (GH17 family)/cellulose synthase/poly-beta-1,6-N-acetylglucosamine synthase-like glycosyltransferase